MNPVGGVSELTFSLFGKSLYFEIWLTEEFAPRDTNFSHNDRMTSALNGFMVPLGVGPQPIRPLSDSLIT